MCLGNMVLPSLLFADDIIAIDKPLGLAVQCKLFNNLEQSI